MPDKTFFAPCPVIFLWTCGDAYKWQTGSLLHPERICSVPGCSHDFLFFYLISIKAAGSMAACHLPQKLLQFLGMHRFSKIIALNIVQSHGFYLLIFRLCLHTLQQNTNIHIMAQSDNKLNKGRIKFTV